MGENPNIYKIINSIPIMSLLSKHYDSLRRNEDGTIIYDEKLKTIADNLINSEHLNSESYNTYDEFFNKISNGVYSTNKKVYSDNNEISDINSPIELARKANESLISTKSANLPQFNHCIYELYKECKPTCKYVNDILTKEIWENWKPEDQIFISAGTGHGKNTFITNELLSKCPNDKIIIFENRKSLMKQQAKEIINKIDPEYLRYYGRNLQEESEIIFGNNSNYMIVSYQSAAQKLLYKNQRFIEFLTQTRYIVFDEAHYIIDDASFNKEINFFINHLLLNNTLCPQATKIYMSASMEEYFHFIQTIKPFQNKPTIISNSDIQDSIAFKTLCNPLYTSNFIKDYIISIPSEYSYIKPYKYHDIETIANTITSNPSNEKWIVFVDKKQTGRELENKLKENGKDVCFICSDNIKTGTAKRINEELISTSSFSCQILIATTVIYNGINIKDDLVKHIVIPFSTVPVIKQLIGRKRIKDNEIINVYFFDIKYNDLKTKYYQNIKHCFNIKGFDPIITPLKHLNQYNSSPESIIYYLSPVSDTDTNTKTSALLGTLNLPAILKIFYDTCFYIFALQRMNSETTDSPLDFVDIILLHLGIDIKKKEIISIPDSMPFESRDKEKQKQEFIVYLEELEQRPQNVIVMDNNDFLALKKKINDLHKAFKGGKNLDTHHNGTERFFTKKMLSDFLSSINIPYEIIQTKSNNKKEHKITITKI